MSHQQRKKPTRREVADIALRSHAINLRALDTVEQAWGAVLLLVRAVRSGEPIEDLDVIEQTALDALAELRQPKGNS